MIGEAGRRGKRCCGCSPATVRLVWQWCFAGINFSAMVRNRGRSGEDGSAGLVLFFRRRGVLRRLHGCVAGKNGEKGEREKKRVEEFRR
ncbi:hypothetical protein HAX54_001816, partial [Datura stramonium]|nr:hypothetical protein [Datura stramonium]